MRKKGFTLVELLAVIVILAVLALIATPIVLGTITKAKKDTFVSSAKNTLDAAVQLDAKGEFISKDGTSVQEMDLKEKDLYEGLVFVNSSGTFILKNFTNGEFCATGTKDDLLVTKGDCANKTLEPSVTAFTVIGKTTKSITVKVEASDDTGIMEYQYCSSNCEVEESWVTSKESTYTYPNLKYSTEYTFYVRVKNRIEKFTEKSVKAATENLPVPTYAVSPSGWQTSKTVKVTYPAGYQYSYTVLEGTVKENGVVVPVGQKRTVSGTSVTLTFESNGRMKAVTSDGYNDATAADLVVSQIDTTAPTGVSVGKGTVTSKSIQVTANGVDNESGITKYEFSKDNGATWITNSSASYTFNNLTTGTYIIKVRLTNGSGLKAESSLGLATNALTAPTYSTNASGWTTSKTVTVTFPSGFTNQVKVTSGTATYNGTTLPVNSWYTVSGNAQIVFKTNGTLIAQVTDGVNAKAGSTLSINQIDTTAPAVNSLSIASTNGSYNAVTTTITSNVTDNSGAAIQMYISNSGYETGGSWQTYGTSKGWDVGGELNGAGHTIYLTFKDQAGNKTNRTLSYTVHKNCAATTTTWSGIWGQCSKECGGGIRYMSGTKYDTKTGAHCGGDSKNQDCNTQSCEPKIELISQNYELQSLVPVNSTTAIGFISGTVSSPSDSTMPYYLDAVVIKIDSNGKVTFGSQTRLGSGSEGMKNPSGVRLTDNRVLISGNARHLSNGYDQMATLAIVEINGTTPKVVGRTTVGDSNYNKTTESLACTSSTSCKFSVLRSRGNNSNGGCTANSYQYNVSISGNSINLSQLGETYSFFASDLESKTGLLHTTTDCDLTSRYANNNTAYLTSGEYVDILNFGWGIGPTKGYQLGVYKNGQRIFDGSKTGTSVDDVQTAAVVRMHANQFLVMNKSDQLLFYDRSGSTWVVGKKLQSNGAHPSNSLVPIGDYHALLYSKFDSSGRGSVGPRPLYLITGY